MSADHLHADGLTRCPWAGTDPLYVAYHDEEWGVPEWDDRALYEKLMLDGFQAGLSWITILRKRDNFRRAFNDFNPEKIARYPKRKIESLMQDAGIVRNRAKIEGAVGSARAWLKIVESGPGFSEMLWKHVRGKPIDHKLANRSRTPTESDEFAGDVQGASEPRLQIRRTDHRLCLHAGGRHGQRPSGDVPSARSLRQARSFFFTREAIGRGVILRRCLLLRKREHPPPPTLPLKGGGRKEARAWQRMLSGRRLDLLDPSPLDVEIEDIAHGLARVARWNGQTKGAHIFSVAQHALLVEALARAKVSAARCAAAAWRYCCTMRRNT